MKRIMILVFCFTALTLVATAQKQKDVPAGSTHGAAEMKTNQDSVSYCIGVQIGMSLHQQKIDANSDLLIHGMLDALQGPDHLALNAQQLQAVLGAFQQKMQERDQKEKSAAGDKNKHDGAAFLAQNGKRKGVTTTASGLQYEVIKEGTGKMPVDSNQVTVHYKGTLIDGTVFDSSIDRGKPATFGVTNVIRGWIEALKLMKEGAKWKIYIPAELAYGEQGQGPIGPNSVLIFEVELIKVL